MKMETKVNVWINVFFCFIFGILFTVAGGLLNGGSVDWEHFLVEVGVAFCLAMVIGLTIPCAKLGGMAAAKFTKPGSFLFKLIMYTVLLIILLIFMCPLLTLFIGCVIMKAPPAAMVPSLYSLAIPFYVIGIVVVMLIGDPVTKLAMKCAGVPSGPT